ncbi:MAG: FAD-binding oxidoreductase [Dehalococcoidia bacterium]|nr:FAD-binding oxidoreductase [Dehalococcoidia bacterium]
MQTQRDVYKRTSDTRALESELRNRISGEVRFDAYSRAMYSTDASIYQMEPVGVVIPRDADDVAAAISTCAKAGVAVLSRGGGTSLAGQTVNHAVVLDFSKYMRNVLDVNQEEWWVSAQPGITLDELNHHLRPHGLHFTPDPTTSSRATVGGAIGNNSCGAHSVVYGKTCDHVKELRVVLSDGQPAAFRPLTGAALEAKLVQQDLEGSIYRGVPRIAAEQRQEIERRYPKLRRRVSGYNLDLMLGDTADLTKLVVGSEGTLVAVTEAKLNLEPMPKMKALAVLHFRELVEAMEATVAVLGHAPSAVELVDRMIIQRSRESLGFARRITFVEGDPQALLVVEFFGESDQELRAKIEALKYDMQRRRLGYACVVATKPEEQANIWAIRTAGLGLLMGVKGDTKPLPFVEDTAVMPEKLPEYVRRFDEVVRSHGTQAAYYGHASEGCLHIRPLINIKQQDGLDKLVAIATDISDLVLEFGGSLSGEHGDGIVRGVWTEKMFGTALYNAFRELKRTFDPLGIMNPGKIVDCPPLTENLRLGPGYRATEPFTILDFSGDGGFARSVELCNGVGACRKTLGGTMCPSYMVTHEEEHSTRGRANALRSVLSGALPASEFTSKRLYDVMDLCLECKGCKGECPSNVDMAKMKYEFLSSYYKRHGMPLRSRMFAGIATLNRWGSRMGPLANAAVANPASRWLLDRFVGIDRRRRLPTLARQTFPQWYHMHTQVRKVQGTSVPAGGLGVSPRIENPPLRDGEGDTGGEVAFPLGQVVLFNDTFMNYSEPQVGQAAVELLETAGFMVLLANPRCCGRPMISKGMLEKAKENARYNVELLFPYAQAGVPIIGCEPSCLLTLRDEYPDLLRSPEAKAVADHSYLLDEFLMKLHREGQLVLRFKETPGKVLFQGHCHQKALAGSADSLAALRLIPGLQVEEVDAGCCGMAGAFGYEKEHYDISMAIGERQLFPVVRSASEARIAITGFSCRIQVRDGTGRCPEHVAEILRAAIEK